MIREDMHKTAVQTQAETGCPETDSGWEGRRERNSGKFSRKQEGRQSERRKLDHLASDQRICFISPNRPALPALPSPNHRPTFSPLSPREDSFQINEEMLAVTSQRLNDSMFSIFEELHSERERKNDQQIRTHRLQIEQLNAQIGLLQSENQSLRSKVQDSLFLHEFLMEREHFISQLTATNCKLSEELRQREEEKRELFEEMMKLQELFERQREELERSVDQWQAKCHKMRRQMEQMVKEQEIVVRKNEDLIAVRQVQNSENQEIRRSPFHSHYPANQVEDRQRMDKSDRAKNRLVRNSKREHSGTKLPLSPDVMPTQQIVTLAKKTSLGELMTCQCDGLVKNLRQKVRYSEIEIDILKRLKLDTQRLADQNEQLKRRNKKLLARIEYLSHNASRRGKSSDSSLELSLSPKRN